MSCFDPARFRILCVEDEPAILSDMVEELRDYGFSVEPAANAEAALPIVEQQAPDLIVCDMQMPGMNGREFLELLRGRDDALGDTPFIFLTAFGDRSTMLDGRRAGADDYLVKPVDYDLLIAAIESHLRNVDRRRQRADVVPAIKADPEQLPDRDAFEAALEEVGDGQMVAVVAADNHPELERRFGSGLPRLVPLARRLERRLGIQVFRINAFKFGLVGPERTLRPLLDRLLGFRVRDHSDINRPEVRITTSIVMACPPFGESGSETVQRLTDGVRIIQREGGARILDVEDDALSELQLASAIRAELVNAIRQGQLHVCLQPKVRSDDMRPVAAEVLVRWVSPLLGRLSPSTFIPIVERAGMLSHVTDWVLRQAALCQVRLRALGLPAQLAVNIGASEFNADLPQRIQAICADVGADPEMIEVEITETTLMTDLSGANGVALALHDAGMALALDDFGTGFSSLSYLRECDVDTIKIDRSFVERVADRESEQKIIGGIIKLAQDLGIATVAEGVETEAQRRWLVANGCELIQGYLVSQPLMFEDYCELLRSA